MFLELTSWQACAKPVVQQCVAPSAFSKYWQSTDLDQRNTCKGGPVILLS